MENNEYNQPFVTEDAPQPVVVETPAEPVIEPYVEPVVEPVVVEAPTEPVVVETPAQPAEEPVQALGFLQTGAIGSMAADGPKKTIKQPHEDSNKVAIHSTKNVRWEEVGVLYRGYNIVTKEQADKWLTRSHVRIATPEEVKKVLG
jgi:hypothetical protein